MFSCTKKQEQGHTQMFPCTKKGTRLHLDVPLYQKKQDEGTLSGKKPCFYHGKPCLCPHDTRHFRHFLGSQHPPPNVKTLCNFEPKIWLEIIITSRDAKSACLNGSKTSCFTIFGVLLGMFWPKNIASRDGCVLLIFVVFKGFGQQNPRHTGENANFVIVANCRHSCQPPPPGRGKGTVYQKHLFFGPRHPQASSWPIVFASQGNNNLARQKQP